MAQDAFQFSGFVTVASPWNLNSNFCDRMRKGDGDEGGTLDPVLVYLDRDLVFFFPRDRSRIIRSFVHRKTRFDKQPLQSFSQLFLNKQMPLEVFNCVGNISRGPVVFCFQTREGYWKERWIARRLVPFR